MCESFTCISNGNRAGQNVFEILHFICVLIAVAKQKISPVYGKFRRDFIFPPRVIWRGESTFLDVPLNQLAGQTLYRELTNYTQ